MNVEIECECPFCGKVHVVEVDLSDLAPDYGWRD